MRLGLQKDGRQLILDPDPVIGWDYEDDPYDVDILSNGNSFTMQFPIKGNEWAFGFASNPQTNENKFKTYSGFSITFDGNIWWPVELDLIRTNRSVTHYEAALNTILTDIIGFKDSYITDLITKAVDLPTGSVTFTDMKAIDPGLYFPIVYVYSEDVITDNIFRLTRTGSDYLLPCWTFQRILDFAFENLSYSLTGSLPFSHLLIHNRILPKDIQAPTLFSFAKINNQLTVADFLPSLNFFTFLRQIAILNGVRFVINEDDKEVRIVKIIDQFDTSNPEDVSNKLAPEIASEQPDIRNFSFSYKNLDKDDWFNKQPAVLPGNDKGEYASVAAFVSDSPDDGDYAFCRIENAYYSYSTALEAQFLADPFQFSYQTGSESVKDYDLEVIPSAKSEYEFKKLGRDFTITDNGSGKVRLNLTEKIGVTHFFGTNWEVKLQEEGESPLYPRKFHAITATSGSISWDLDLDFVAYFESGVQVDQKIDVIEIRRPLTDFFPMIGGGPFHYPEFGYEGRKDFTPRVLNAHPDNYASPDRYKENSVLSDTATTLQFVQTDSLPELVWNPIHQKIQKSRKLIFTGYLSPFKLQKLIRNGIGKFPLGFFRFRRLRCQLTNRGVEDQEIEGYSL